MRVLSPCYLFRNILKTGTSDDKMRVFRPFSVPVCPTEPEHLFYLNPFTYMSTYAIIIE